MTNTITAGLILVENGTSMPDSLLLRTGPFSAGWAEVKGTRATFEKAIENSQWTFFFMAGEITTTVFGFDREKNLRAALVRLGTGVKSQHCNSIEITSVADKSFLGVPYVSVSAHARHLQEGLFFSSKH